MNAPAGQATVGTGFLADLLEHHVNAGILSPSGVPWTAALVGEVDQRCTSLENVCPLLNSPKVAKALPDMMRMVLARHILDGEDAWSIFSSEASVYGGHATATSQRAFAVVAVSAVLELIHRDWCIQTADNLEVNPEWSHEPDSEWLKYACPQIRQILILAVGTVDQRMYNVGKLREVFSVSLCLCVSVSLCLCVSVSLCICALCSRPFFPSLSHYLYPLSPR
jgi:hypothetical protein